MPEVSGLEFPEHEHREFPKVLYLGGVERDSEGTVSETKTVHSADEEAEAIENGFGAVGAAIAEEAEVEEAPAAEAAPEPAAPQEAAPPAQAEAPAAAQPDPLDHDGDGKKGGSRKGTPRKKPAPKK